MLIRECQSAHDERSAKGTNASKPTHHDLRHLFATRCIESGVDIPQIALVGPQRWRGPSNESLTAARRAFHRDGSKGFIPQTC